MLAQCAPGASHARTSPRPMRLHTLDALAQQALGPGLLLRLRSLPPPCTTVARGAVPGNAAPGPRRSPPAHAPHTHAPLPFVRLRALAQRVLQQARVGLPAPAWGVPPPGPPAPPAPPQPGSHPQRHQRLVLAEAHDTCEQRAGGRAGQGTVCVHAAAGRGWPRPCCMQRALASTSSTRVSRLYRCRHRRPCPRRRLKTQPGGRVLCAMPVYTSPRARVAFARRQSKAQSSLP